MKHLLLNSLTLSQFKGVKSVSLEPQGENFNVYGDNASGKTTIADAFVWLLFGKNLAGSAKFEIKTLDENNEPLHHLNHSVTGEFRLPDESITLGKTYKEKWVKQRGKLNQEFEGHTTDHTINKVPVQEKEYAARVASICDENLFRILSDPLRFNEGLTWQERRKELMRFAGNITDDAVTQAHPALAEVTAILGSHTPEDMRKMLLSMRPAIAKEVDAIPVRIDELQRAIADAPVDSSMPNMEHYRSQLIQLQNDRATITSGGQMAELRKKRAELEAAELLRISEERKAVHQMHDQALAEARDLAAKAQEAKDRVTAAERDARALEGEIHRMGEDLEVKRAAYRDLSAASWDTEAEGVCRSCGQVLPADRLDALRDDYNLRKAKRLEANREEGKALNSQREAKKIALEALTSTISDLSEAASLVDKEWSVARARATAEPDMPGNQEAEAHRKALAILDAQISELMTSNADALNRIDTDIVDVQRKIQAAEGVIAKAEAAKSAGARISELSDEEKRLAGEIEEIDRKLYLLDEWVRAKVSMLEESINSRFEIVKFKLFMVQVNGAIAEVCETTVNGVPWGNLNHGARINGGLDIINTLARHYGFAPPIFIDNAESVTSIIPTMGQQIRLIVSAADKELHFESATTKTINTKELQLA